MFRFGLKWISTATFDVHCWAVELKMNLLFIGCLQIYNTRAHAFVRQISFRFNLNFSFRGLPCSCMGPSRSSGCGEELYVQQSNASIRGNSMHSRLRWWSSTILRIGIGVNAYRTNTVSERVQMAKTPICLKNHSVSSFIPFRLNVTNMEEPYFLVEALDTLHSIDSTEDRSYKVVIYAVNQKGRSSKVTLKDFVVGDRNQSTACKYHWHRDCFCWRFYCTPTPAAPAASKNRSK